MATEWENNEKLHQFVFSLQSLNKQSAEMLRTGDMTILPKMNGVIEVMYALQHGNEDEAFTMVEEEMQMICKNFDGIVAMLQSNEGDRPDAATTLAVKKFLHNIFDATVRIVYIYGLA